jgi:DNA-directed RNA polymerase subunit RPC12/RpoP
MFVTLKRPWRAHAELDGLSDTECRELIERRWRRDPPPLLAASLFATVCGLLWVPIVIVLLVTLTTIDDDPEANPVAVYTVLGAIALCGALAVGVYVRWLLEHVLTCRALRRIVAGAVCPRCSQPLRGLPIIDDAHRPEDQSRMRVRCPECGKMVRLLKYGYGPQDLAVWEERVLPKDFEVRVRE